MTFSDGPRPASAASLPSFFYRLPPLPRLLSHSYFITERTEKTNHHFIQNQRNKKKTCSFSSFAPRRANARLIYLRSFYAPLSRYSFTSNTPDKRIVPVSSQDGKKNSKEREGRRNEERESFGGRREAAQRRSLVRKEKRKNI